MRIFYTLLLFSTVMFSQKPILTEENKADSLHFAKDFTNSIALRTKILQVKTNVRTDFFLRNSLKVALSNYYLTKDWSEGLAALEKVKKDVIEKRLLSDKFINEFYTNYYHAIAYATNDWEKALEVANQYLEQLEKKKLKTDIKTQTELVYDIAYINSELKNHYVSIEFYLKAKLLYDKQGLNNSTEMALLFNNLGYEYSQLSDYKKCNEFYILATQIWEQNPEENANYLTTAYNNLIYNLLPYGEIKKAEYYYFKLQKASLFIDKTDVKNVNRVKLSVLLNDLKIKSNKNNTDEIERSCANLFDYYKTIKGDDDFVNYYSTAVNTLNNHYIEINQFDKSIAISLEAEKHLKQKNYSQGLLLLYSSLSNSYRQQKIFDKSLKYINLGLEKSSNTIIGNQSGLLLSKGMVLNEMNRTTEAKKYYKRSKEVIAKEQFADFEVLSYSIEIARFYHVIYESNKSKHNFDEAFLCFKKCVSIFDKIYKDGLHNDKLTTYLRLIHEGLLKLAQQESAVKAEAINLIENSTSKYLWSNFIKNNASKKISKLDADYAAIQDLIKEKAHIKKIIQTEREKKNSNLKTIKDLEDRVVGVDAKMEQLQVRLNTINPAFSKFYEANFLIADLTKLLDAKQKIINYYETEKEIFAVLIDVNGVQKIVNLGSKKVLYDVVKSYTSQLNSKNFDKKFSENLYQKLVKPLGVQLTDCTIISKGVLSLLPFETLIYNGKYLVENTTIHYASSLRLYFLQKQLTRKSDFNIAVFNPDYSNTKFSSLPFAAKEASFLQANFQANLFANKQATTSNFLKNTANYNVYHLAMHADINLENEDASKLVFSNSSMYFSDIFAEQIPLDLVTLGACETGLGKFYDGEGIMSLSRAFTYSGVSSNIHSLWKAPDKQAFEIMAAFYEFLGQGDTKSEALQKAKTNFLKKYKGTELEDPYYWSGFVLIGNPSALVEKTNPMIYGVFMVLALICLALFLKFRK